MLNSIFGELILWSWDNSDVLYKGTPMKYEKQRGPDIGASWQRPDTFQLVSSYKELLKIELGLVYDLAFH